MGEADADAYRRLVFALCPRSADTRVRIRQDGTIDPRGRLDLDADPADQRSTSRAMTIRCTSLVPSPISHSLASR